MGFLEAEAYELIRRSVPIATVDLLCVFAGHEERSLLLIEREDGLGRPGMLNLVGGRIYLGETLEHAALRHLQETLGPAVVSEPRDWGRPEWVGVYLPGTSGPGPFDPRQHSISPSYVLRCSGKPEARGEATGLHWCAVGALPGEERFGFGQGPVVAELVKALG